MYSTSQKYMIVVYESDLAIRWLIYCPALISVYKLYQSSHKKPWLTFGRYYGFQLLDGLRMTVPLVFLLFGPRHVSCTFSGMWVELDNSMNACISKNNTIQQDVQEQR